MAPPYHPLETYERIRKQKTHQPPHWGFWIPVDLRPSNNPNHQSRGLDRLWPQRQGLGKRDSELCFLGCVNMSSPHLIKVPSLFQKKNVAQVTLQLLHLSKFHNNDPKNHVSWNPNLLFQNFHFEIPCDFVILNSSFRYLATHGFFRPHTLHTNIYPTPPFRWPAMSPFARPSRKAFQTKEHQGKHKHSIIKHHVFIKFPRWFTLWFFIGGW